MGAIILRNDGSCVPRNNIQNLERRGFFMPDSRFPSHRTGGFFGPVYSGKQYGRPKATITADWDDTYNQWKSGDISADDAARKLGISKATLYRRSHD